MENPPDPNRPRGLELNVRDVVDDGGRSIAQSARLGRTACDGFLMVAVQERGRDETPHTSVVSMVPNGRGAMSYMQQYVMWVSLAKHLIDNAPDTAQAQKVRQFLVGVLAMMRLSPEADFTSGPTKPVVTGDEPPTPPQGTSSPGPAGRSSPVGVPAPSKG